MATKKKPQQSARKTRSRSSQEERRKSGAKATTKKASAKSATASKKKATRTTKKASASRTTIDHDEIRRWAEERGAVPSAVIGTSRRGQDPGIIRLDFPGYSGEGKLEEISWDEFFEKFDENGLALVYQQETAKGERSNFNKLVKRDAA